MHLLLSFVFVAAAVPAFAAAQSPAGDDFSMLFASTCMKHFHTPDTLRAAMVGNEVEELIGEQSRFFLDGAPGTAWILDGSSGKYVVSLRDDAICAVFAQQATPEVVRAGFEALVEVAPAPLVSRRIEEATPLPQETANTVTYAWSRPEDDVELVFMLTTSTAPGVSAQAMASMAVAKKED